MVRSPKLHGSVPIATTCHAASLSTTLNNAAETISTTQFIVMSVTANVTMAYHSRERPTNDPTATTKLAANKHRSARSSLPPTKTAAAKINAPFFRHVSHQ
ncbi:MAG TPA: hypothetical protein VEF35_01705 [Candidatus Bathyarchaeia archaeon]|nr:hypothetical protein [Candidatus Bathyarchaeia archaeon]